MSKDKDKRTGKDTRKHFGGKWFGNKKIVKSRRLPDVVTPPAAPAPVDKRPGNGMRLWNDDVDDALYAAGVHYEPLSDDDEPKTVEVDGVVWVRGHDGTYRTQEQARRMYGDYWLEQSYRGYAGEDTRTVTAQKTYVPWDWRKPEWTFTCEKCQTQSKTRADFAEAQAQAIELGWQLGADADTPTLCPAHARAEVTA